MAEKMDEETVAKVKGILLPWKGKRGNLIMALLRVQEALGYVPWEAMEIASVELNVPMARIYSVVTFYNYFKLKTPGKVVVMVCDGTACHIQGSPALVEAFEKQLGVKSGETTSDGLFYLQVVRCLGCCGLAPVVVVNGKTYRTVAGEDVAKIIAEWRAAMG
ncbi:MAG: NAD(P)H-dependent oxidoreductase subunit E [Alphaproteobacteria bacterium]|nr:NAD(P)H-dependent oxidoreductase subunit E [Alphaproteobacteria bacterium]